MFGSNEEERKAIALTTVVLIGGWLAYLAWYLR